VGLRDSLGWAGLALATVLGMTAFLTLVYRPEPDTVIQNVIVMTIGLFAFGVIAFVGTATFPARVTRRLREFRPLVRLMVELHIERRLRKLLGYYRGILASQPVKGDALKELDALAKRVKEWADHQRTFVKILYLSSPPVLGLMCSIFAFPHVPALPITFAIPVAGYLLLACTPAFSRKRSLFVSPDGELQMGADGQLIAPPVYWQEQATFECLSVSSPREFPFDIVAKLAVFGGTLLVILSIAVDSGPAVGGGIVKMFGGGKIADMMIPLAGCIVMIILTIWDFINRVRAGLW
jgi:hypothetical protein